MITPHAIQYVETPNLKIAYEQHGPTTGEAVILLHGFPYSPRAYDDIAPALAAQGLRVIVPYLRGYGPTRFNSPDTLRSGQQAALAQDLLDLLNALAIPQVALCGYDWGVGRRALSRRYGRSGFAAWSPAMATTFKTFPVQPNR
uniref:alpha/beta fold hydrolase n=1 Tax=Pseudomonas sp. TH31 TaxID=2796396 RepID=UPI00313B8645